MQMRVNVVVVVSPAKYPKITSHVQRLNSPSVIVLVIKAPKEYPRNKLPESPMKMDAGGQLNSKKPEQQSASSTKGSTTPRSPVASKITMVAAEQMKTAPDAAMPSTPSMKL